MLKNISRSIREILVGLYRSKGIFLLWILTMLYTFYEYNFYASQPGGYSYSLMTAIKGLEVMMLVMLLLGMSIVRQAQNEGVNELYASLPNGRMVLAGGQLGAIFIVTMFTTALIMIYDIISAALGGAPKQWIHMNMAAIVLQFFLPMLICGLAGMCAAFWIKNRGVYAVLLLFWCVTGTLSEKLFSYLEVSGLVRSPFWEQIINLGIQEFGLQLQDFNGGPFRELPRWIAKGSYALWLLVLFAASVANASRGARLGRRLVPWRPIVAAALVIPMMLGLRYGVGDFFTYYSSTMRGYSYTDERYIVHEPGGQSYLTGEPNRSREDQVTVISNKLEVKAGYSGLKVTSQQTLEADEAIDTQCFTLFRRFAIEELLLNDKPVSYVQSKDAVYVDFPETIPQGARFELTFRYGGKSLPQAPVNEYTVQLRVDFPWIPWPGLREDGEIDTSAIMKRDQIEQGTIEYELNYEGPGDLYINLPQVGEGMYKGNSDMGVVIYSGMMKKEYPGMTLYLPAALYSQADGYHEAAKGIIEVYGRMPESVGWLVSAEKLDDSWRQYQALDTIYIMQDHIEQVSNILEVQGSSAAYKFVGAMPASRRAAQGSSFEDTKSLYSKMMEEAFLLMGITSLERSDGRYYIACDYLTAYCQYRDGLLTNDNLTAFFKDPANQLLLLPNQSEHLAELWQETPRERLDAFFLDWMEQLVAGNPPYSAMTGDEVYNAMVDWCTES